MVTFLAILLTFLGMYCIIVVVKGIAQPPQDWAESEDTMKLLYDIINHRVNGWTALKAPIVNAIRQADKGDWKAAIEFAGELYAMAMAINAFIYDGNAIKYLMQSPNFDEYRIDLQEVKEIENMIRRYSRWVRLKEENGTFTARMEDWN